MFAARSVGTVEWFVPPADALAVEAVWGQVESRLPEALKVLDLGGVVNAGSRVEETLQDCLAVHWARSKAVRAVHATVLSQARSELRGQLDALPEGVLDQVSAELYGLVVEGPVARADVLDQAVMGSSALGFGERVVAYFRRARDRNRKARLEVYDCAPGSPDLVISDCPVLSPNHHGTALNPRQGSGLGAEVGMPLGPRVAVSLRATGPRRRRIGSAEVQQLNAMQEQVTDRYLYRRP